MRQAAKAGVNDRMAGGGRKGVEVKFLHEYAFFCDDYKGEYG